MVRPLLRFAVSFVLGVFLGQTVFSGAWLPWAAAAVLFSGAAVMLMCRKYRAVVAVQTAGVSLGILWVAIYSALYLMPVESLVGTERIMTLRLLEYPEKQVYQVRCAAQAEGIRGKVMFYGDDDLLALSPGDTLTGAMKCYSAVHVGGKDVATYTSNGIVLRLYGQGEVTVEKGTEDNFRFLPQKMRQKLCATVDEIFDEDTQGFVLALLMGERDELDEQSASDLEESGLMHLTAVSGLHCGFLLALLGVLVFKNPYLKVCIGYPTLLFYMVMVGCTPSVVRACIMAAFPLVAPLFEREDDPPTSLAASAMVILLANPFAVMSISFQLSFAAVTGILLFTPTLCAYMISLKRWKRRYARRLWTGAAALVSANLGALFLTIPISAYYFRTISLVAPLSNLLVLPVISVLFGAALMVTALCMISPMFSSFALPVSVLVKYVLRVAGFTAKIPNHAVSFSGALTAMWLVFVYGLLFLCLVSKDGKRKYAVAVVLSLMTLMIVRAIPRELVKSDALTIVSVDVGQGAATLLHSRGVTTLVDCGSHYSQRGSGASVSDAMDTYGWDTIDYLVLTHYHRDHAGGLYELLARTTVEMLILPWETEEETSDLSREVLRLAERYGIAVEYIYDDIMTLAMGKAMLTIYPQLTHGKVNEEGLTVLCSVNEFDVLLNGDMGMATEELLLETYELPDIEVLFVAHHGSKYSTSYRFLREILPEVGIISVGENNYGHPAMETMERMAYYGAELYRTDWQGNIVIQVR